MRILIAEDETIIRLDLRGLRERNGLVVCAEARDGAEAVDLARETKPDVAVLDLRMPALDGIEAARRIYAERPIPIVMLTAFSERSYVDKAIAAGVFTYLVKPFREGDVVPAIRAATARHAELLAARRTLGAEPPRPLDLDDDLCAGAVVLSSAAFLAELHAVEDRRRLRRIRRRLFHPRRCVGLRGGLRHVAPLFRPRGDHRNGVRLHSLHRSGGRRRRPFRGPLHVRCLTQKARATHPTKKTGCCHRRLSYFGAEGILSQTTWRGSKAMGS